MNSTGYDGTRVLIIEDEMLVAMLLEDMLSDLGCTVVGTAGRVDAAKAAIESQPMELAILDMNLHGERTTALAEMLAQRGIPFIFATGYGDRDLAPEFRQRPLLTKPFLEEDLSAALATALGRES